MAKDALVCPVRAGRGFPRLALLMPVLLLVAAAPSAAQETWTPTKTVGAPSARYVHTAVWTGSEMIVWGGIACDGLGCTLLNTGGILDPVADAWTATSTTNAPTPRIHYTAVWMGSKMIVWGGRQNSGPFANTGGLYDPATDTWTATSTTGAPDGRELHSAIWTGSKMIVWGGWLGGNSSGSTTNTGGIYDPATDTWTAMSTPGYTCQGPAAAVWTGSKMIVWPELYQQMCIYDPVTDTWAFGSTLNAPAHNGPNVVWTGSKMIVFGGGNAPHNTGGIYDPATNMWTATSTTNAPTAWNQAAVWTGSKMIVWGGEQPGGPPGSFLATGDIYDPNTDLWNPTSAVGAPSARSRPTAVWTGSKMIVWGGLVAVFPEEVTNTGGVYSPQAVADLSVTKTDGASGVVPGLPVTYTIRVSNGGPYATGAHVTDTFPVSLTGMSWTCSASAGSSCAAASGSGSIDEDVILLVGGVAAFTATGTLDPAAAGTLVNTATVTPPRDLIDPDLINNAATDTDTILIPADVSATKTDGLTTVVPGQGITYTIVASNAGPNNVNGVIVSDPVPASLLTPAWTCVAAGGASCTASGSGDISDTINLPVGGTATYTLSVTLGSSHSRLSNTATVTLPAGYGDPNPADNSATDTDLNLDPSTDFYTVTPCRVFDTREPGGPTSGAPLTCGSERVFAVVGECGVPSGATAVSVNVTGTGSTAQGNLRLFPAGTPVPLVSTLNYAAGQTRANNAVAPLGAAGQISMLCSPSGTTHVVLDVNGYFE